MIRSNRHLGGDVQRRVCRFSGSLGPRGHEKSSKSDKKSIKANTLFGAWETNLDVRPEQDWKELKGRAVVDE